MNIPPWLAAMTGAGGFANNPANGFAPTVGDAFQGIGHSMMEHFRAGQQAPPNAAAAGAPVPPMSPPQQMGGLNPGAQIIPPNPLGRPTPQVQQFVSPDIAKLVAQSQGAPLVGVPTPLAGTGTPLSEIAKLFAR